MEGEGQQMPQKDNTKKPRASRSLPMASPALSEIEMVYIFGVLKRETPKR